MGDVLCGSAGEDDPGGDNDTADGEEEPEYLPWTTLTLDDVRRRLSAWHFAKEALSADEQRILYVAEALLRLIDERGARSHGT